MAPGTVLVIVGGALLCAALALALAVLAAVAPILRFRVYFDRRFS